MAELVEGTPLLREQTVTRLASSNLALSAESSSSPMKSFNELVRVMTQLRKGCPWDKKQTHESLLKYLTEESKEFQLAVKKRDYENMEEELGDVLLQVLFHSEIAKEKKRFNIDDVVRTLIRKLKLRHPHVFGYTKEHRQLLKGKKLTNEKEVLANWKLLKQISLKKR